MRPSLEPLEDRVVPTGYFVNGLGDTSAGSGNTGDLRYVIGQINANGSDLGNIITFQNNAQPLTGTITLNSALPTIAKPVSINGTGDTSLDITRNSAQGTPQFTIFSVGNGVKVTIDNLEISGGKGVGNGGGVYNVGNLTLTNVIVDNNTAINGAGVYNITGSTLSLNNVSMYNNTASNVGGAIYNDGNLNITNSSQIYVNDAVMGGGIYNDDQATTTITQSSIYSNTATNGAGIYNLGSFTWNGGSFTGNQASQDGGGIYNKSGTANLQNLNIQKNTATGNGGGFVVYGGSVSLTSCTLSNNKAGTGAGGAWKVPGSFTVSGGTITDPIVQLT